MHEILVLYYSRQGSTAALARQICRGVETVAGVKARLRTVAPISTTIERSDPAVPDDGPPYAAA
jgi:NAD(P)H dehydrogenase (quinone)